jgi:hypothetical protein
MIFGLSAGKGDKFFPPQKQKLPNASVPAIPDRLMRTLADFSSCSL